MAQIRRMILSPGLRLKASDEVKFEVQQAAIFLDMFGICQNLNVLPLNGGLLVQDSMFVFLMKYAMLCQKDREELDRAKSSH